MSSSETSRGTPGGVTPSRSVDAFLEAKLHWPRVREGWVDRHRLLDLFDEATRRPVCLVAAPAGYGKTTLTAQWLASLRGDRVPPPGCPWTRPTTTRVGSGPTSPRRSTGPACALAPDVAGSMAGDRGDLIAGMLPQIVHGHGGRATTTSS